MQLVRARLEYQIHLGADVTTEGRIIIIGEDLVFADRVNGWRNRESVQLWIPIENPVQEEVIRAFAGTVHVEAEVAPLRPGGALCGGRRPRNEQRQFIEVAAIERQVADLPVLDHRAEGSGLR